MALNTSVESCKQYETCKAPICPLDRSFTLAVWYPAEPICVALKFRRDDWRIAQRKIVKLNSKSQVPGYFDVSMLRQIKQVRRGITGKVERIVKG